MGSWSGIDRVAQNKTVFINIYREAVLSHLRIGERHLVEKTVNMVYICVASALILISVTFHYEDGLKFFASFVWEALFAKVATKEQCHITRSFYELCILYNVRIFTICPYKVWRKSPIWRFGEKVS